MAHGFDSRKPSIVEIAKVALDNFDVEPFEGAASPEQPVEDDGNVPGFEKLPAQNNADIAGATGHKHAHLTVVQPQTKLVPSRRWHSLAREAASNGYRRASDAFSRSEDLCA